MMKTAILRLLNDELDHFPDRASGEHLYEHVNRITARHVVSNREELIYALKTWLQLRSEPKTMLAVDIAGNLQLNELSHSLEDLLLDVEQGRAFKSFYSRPIEAAISMIRRCP